MFRPSRYECPRCGFGIRPEDEQCGRCGEDLKPKATRPVQVQISAVKLNRSQSDECSTMRIRTVETVPVARPDSSLQMKADDLERRERALVERERKVAAMEGELKEAAKRGNEERTEQAPPEIDMDALRGKIREDLARQFEPELEAMQHQLEAKEAELQEVLSRLGGENGEAVPEVDPAELARLSDEIFRDLQGQLENPPPVEHTRPLLTHISKFDEVLGGGIPQGHTVLFCGAPGTLKSTLTYAILHNAAKLDGLPGMYLSLEQSVRSISKQMERMGMPRSETGGLLKLVDLKEMRQDMAGEEGNWRELLLKYVQKEQEATGFRLFVLDSLESFKAVTEHCFSRQELKDLFDWFRDLGITVLVISEKVSDEWDESNQGEAYLSDGIIELQMKEVSDSRVQRWVRCVKMRGSRSDPRYYSIFYDGNVFNMSLPLSNQPF